MKKIKRISTKFKIVMSLLLSVALAMPVFLFSACSGRTADYSFSLSRTVTNRIFESENQLFTLPTIITNEAEYSVEWSISSNSIASNPVAYLVDDKHYRIDMIDPVHQVTRAYTIITATIIGSDDSRHYLNYRVNVTDIPATSLTHISSTNHINYTARGIGNNVVFGLKDIYLPSGTATPGRWNGSVWEDGTWTEAEFVNSYSSFELRWNYRGEVEIEVWIEQQNAAGNFIRLYEEDYSNNDIARVVYDPEDCIHTVTVYFKNPGIARVVAESREESRPGFSPRYEFIYEIKDAVNVRNFDEIKLMERLARYTYITEGVVLENGQHQTRVGGAAIAGASARGRTLGHYIDPYNYDGLLSLHFNTIPTPTPEHYIENTPSAVQWTGFDDDGEFFEEFNHWAPSFRFKDIVIRSNIDRMETWAEGTWFFGSVFGNGIQLDATPYTRSEEGRYRNVHSLRGQPNGDSLGFEGRRFFPGYGWGDIYAFYILANNSIMDNITLTGENIPQGNTAIRLNQYHKIGVVGTSKLAGMNDKEFSIGNAHDNGVFKQGLYIEGITIQNSIIEKGLTLVGAGFAPDGNNPITVSTSVLRFGGFTGILGVSFGGGIGEADPENGAAVFENNNLSRRYNQAIIHPEGGNFGNFIVARNNLFHDISVSPILTMPSRSGSHISVEGNENHFFTWLRSNDIQFPEMTDPAHEGFARIMGGSINGMIPSLMNRVFTNNNNMGPPSGGGRGHTSSAVLQRTWSQTEIARYEQPNGVFLVNIPVINVTDENQAKNNFVTFEHSILRNATETAIGLVSDHAGGNTPRGLNQRFDLTMLHSPLRASLAVRQSLIGVAEMNTMGINARIANMVPVGTRVPASITSREVELIKGFCIDSNERIVLRNATNTSLLGHRIEFNGQRVNSIFHSASSAEQETISIGLQDFINAGIDSFGLYNFDLIAPRAREPVSRFSLAFQGELGFEPPNVVPGTEDFTEEDRYIKFNLNLPFDDRVAGVTLLGDFAFPQSVNIDASFINGRLRIRGAQLRHGDNTFVVSTYSGVNLTFRQPVIRYDINVDAMPVDLRTNSPFVLNLLGNDVNMRGIGITIGGRELESNQFTVSGRTITVPNPIIRDILGFRYVDGTSVPVVITNERGLALATHLRVIEERMSFAFAINAVSTPQNSATGVNQPFINIAYGHRHFNNINIELVNHAGDNVLGISFANTDDASLARSQMVRFNDMPGARTEFLQNGNTRLVIPPLAAAQAGLAAGTTHRVWVFTSLHALRTSNATNQQVRIFNANHNDGLNLAPRFINDNFTISKNATNAGEREIGFSSFAYLFDKFISETPAEFDVPDDIPIIGGTTISLPTIPISDYNDFSQSTFSDTGSIFTIRNAAGHIVYEFTRDEIFFGNPLVSFDTTNGGTRVEERWLSTTIGIGSLLIPLPINIPPLDAYYVTGFELSQQLLSSLGIGTFTIEARNNFNISFATLTITE